MWHAYPFLLCILNTVGMGVFSAMEIVLFFFICCVECLSCLGMLTDMAAANPPGQPDPALVLSLFSWGRFLAVGTWKCGLRLVQGRRPWFKVFVQ